MDDPAPANIKSSATNALKNTGAPLNRNGQTLGSTFQTGKEKKAGVSTTLPMGGPFTGHSISFVRRGPAIAVHLELVQDRRRQEIEPADLKLRQLHAEVDFHGAAF